MSKNKHTPGPWHVTPEGYIGSELYGYVPLITPFRREANRSNIHGGADDQARANARLIAAAPDMLETLREAVKCVEYCRRAHPDNQSGTGFPIEEIWKALLAKIDSKGDR